MTSTPPASTGARATRGPDRRRATPRAPDARDVADLSRSPDGRPCISVLLPTRPGPRMDPGDVARMRELAEQAERQLRDQGVPGRAELVRRLQTLLRRAATEPTDLGLAIYVGGDTERAFRLPMPVAPRALVEPTFATRALFAVLHRMPPYVLLVLHPACAHLYRGGDGSLRAVGDRDVFRGSGAIRLPRRGEPTDAATTADVTDRFLDGVDRLLGAYRAEHPSPLVLAGDPHLMDRFCATSHHLDRLAGRVPPAGNDSATALAATSAEVVIRYLASRRDEALARLRGALASRPADVARGMGACWQAAHQRAPGLLLVEETFVSPGSASVVGVGPVPEQAQGPGRQVHDLVDDLMEVVILRGGQLALVDEGDLAAHGRIALVSGFPDPLPAPGPGTVPG